MAKNDKIKRFKQTFLLSKKEYDRYSQNWTRYEALYLGAKENIVPKDIQETDSNGTPIIIYRNTVSDRKEEMPDRVQNNLFGQIQSELALYSRTEPTVRVVPKSLSAREKARRLNLFNDHVFLEKLPQEMTFMQANVLMFGHGFLQTFIKKNIGDHKIPFSIMWESSRNIMFDPNADRWEDVKWVIKKIKKYYYEVVAKYPDLKNYAKNHEDFDIIEYHEYWEKNFEDGKWERSVIYNQEYELKTDKQTDEIDYRYPDVPIELFKIYRREKGCAGISQVQLQYDAQSTINKRASMLDYKISYDIDPAVEINETLVDEEALSNFQNLYPGKKIPVKQNGAVKPLSLQLINNSELYSSIQVLDDNMRTISGVQPVLEGTNEKGAYSFKQFNAIRESANVRIDMKLEWYNKSIINLAKKIYQYAQDYLGDTDYFEVYDYEKEEMLHLAKDDFNLDDLNIVVEVQDANLLHPGERLKTLLEMSQYLPDLDRRFIILAIDQASHGIIPPELLERVENSLEQERQQNPNPTGILTPPDQAQAQQMPPDAGQMPPMPPEAVPPMPTEGQPEAGPEVEQARAMMLEAGLPTEEVERYIQESLDESQQAGAPFTEVLSRKLSEGGM